MTYRSNNRTIEEQSVSSQLFKNFFPNTELGVDLKLFTHKPGRMKVVTYLDSIITRDNKEHYTFVENDFAKRTDIATHRNPHVYAGKCIKVNQSGDGTLYPTLNRLRNTKKLTFQDFSCEATTELLMVAGNLGKKKTVK